MRIIHLALGVVMILFAIMAVGCNPNKKVVDQNQSSPGLNDQLVTYNDTIYAGTYTHVKEFDGSGVNIFSIKLISGRIPDSKMMTAQKGKVSTLVCINKDGAVQFARYLPGESTIKDKNIIRSLIDTVMTYRYAPDDNTTETRCGRLWFEIDKDGIVYRSDNEDKMSLGELPESTTWDNSGDGVFGRKIIYRDLSPTRAIVNTSGRVVTKVCINPAGLVTYVELIPAETTIKDKPTLRHYLKAARGYKFQPDLTAPKEQCGKLSFFVDNKINNKFR